ncbi:Transcription initiation factor TFIID subunit 13 [Physocladia obscura]|uniref:Transcription initiation factor TFIID subunit 13 n=1 Tax=Physocladia obscura TaxID=109957 RepID=A0AAD5T0A3_9FUNG|nr:Transcription initiation factor TFIID subunit 13 [Physocladia obscura]
MESEEDDQQQQRQQPQRQSGNAGPSSHAKTNARDAKDKESGGRKKIFGKDIRPIMYGYGDVIDPADDTVDVVEDMLIMFLEDVVAYQLSNDSIQCAKAVSASNTGRIRIADITFALRKDPRKLARVLELIATEKEIAKARNVGGEDVQMKGRAAGGAFDFDQNKRRRTDDDDDDDDYYGEKNNDAAFSDDTNDFPTLAEIKLRQQQQQQVNKSNNPDDDYDDILLE